MPEPLGYGKEDVAEAVVGHVDFKVGRMGCGVLVSLVAVGGQERINDAKVGAVGVV